MAKNNDVIESGATEEKVEVKPAQKQKDVKAVNDNKNKKSTNKNSNKKNANTEEKKTVGQKTKAMVSELKKVTWPTFGQTLKQTGVVIAFVLMFVVILLGVNALFGWLFDLIITTF